MQLHISIKSAALEHKAKAGKHNFSKYSLAIMSKIYYKENLLLEYADEKKPSQSKVFLKNVELLINAGEKFLIT